MDQYTENNYVIDEDIAWLLGIIICKGHICDNKVSITLDYKTENDIKNKRPFIGIILKIKNSENLRI